MDYNGCVRNPETGNYLDFKLCPPPCLFAGLLRLVPLAADLRPVVLDDFANGGVVIVVHVALLIGYGEVKPPRETVRCS